MTPSATAEIDRNAADVAWDLEPLVHGKGEAGFESLLDEAERRAKALGIHHGKIASMDAATFAALMREIGEISDLLGRAGGYAELHLAIDSESPARGALAARADERITAIGNELIFVRLEWANLPDDRAEALLADHALDFCRHYLVVARRNRPHLRSEPEERILADKSVTGRSAWVRLYEDLTAAIKVTLPEGTVSLEEGLAKLHVPDRNVRRLAAEAVTAALEPGLRTRTFVLNTLLADKSSDDRLRSYATWIQSMNLDNEASDESVQALIDAVMRRYDIPRRWYALKSRLLGVDRIADYDRYAPVTAAETHHGWSASRDLVRQAYRAFSPELGSVVDRFLEEPWIDAPVRPSKRTGAFCAYSVPSHHPYIFLNWTGRRRDVLTLAHELGHGAHAYLARGQGIFHLSTPLTLAETASVFGEALTFEHLLRETTDKEERFSLLAESLEGMIATVFRQIALNRFEHAIHSERRERGELSVDRLGDLWIELQGAMLGEAVELTPGFRTWWSYVTHFYSLPGYVYAYAYGQLFALSVYREYQRRGASFVPQYLELLQRGGSMPPEALAAIVGIDIGSTSFWDGGIALIEERLQATERAAAEAGRL